MDGGCVSDVMGVVRWLGPLFPQYDYHGTGTGLWDHVVQVTHITSTRDLLFLWLSTCP